MSSNSRVRTAIAPRYNNLTNPNISECHALIYQCIWCWPSYHPLVCPVLPNCSPQLNLNMASLTHDGSQSDVEGVVCKPGIHARQLLVNPCSELISQQSQLRCGAAAAVLQRQAMSERRSQMRLCSSTLNVSAAWLSCYSAYSWIGMSYWQNDRQA